MGEIEDDKHVIMKCPAYDCVRKALMVGIDDEYEYDEVNQMMHSDWVMVICRWWGNGNRKVIYSDLQVFA